MSKGTNMLGRNADYYFVHIYENSCVVCISVKAKTDWQSELTVL